MKSLNVSPSAGYIVYEMELERIKVAPGTGKVTRDSVVARSWWGRALARKIPVLVIFKATITPSRDIIKGRQYARHRVTCEGKRLWIERNQAIEGDRRTSVGTQGARIMFLDPTAATETCPRKSLFWSTDIKSIGFIFILTAAFERSTHKTPLVEKTVSIGMLGSGSSSRLGHMRHASSRNLNG
jgi:hypothetical protein